MTRPVLLDTSFLIALERETARGEEGPARRFLLSLRGRPLSVSIVSVEELLEGAVNEPPALLSSCQRRQRGLTICAEPSSRSIV